MKRKVIGKSGGQIVTELRDLWHRVHGSARTGSELIPATGSMERSKRNAPPP